MELEHEFIVPVPVEQAWLVLLDVERVAPCMPGATLDSIGGDEFTGRLKVKVGPVTMTYRGTVGFTSKDEQTHTVTIEGSGKETRGSGTASATMRASLRSEEEATRVTVHTDLKVTGRPAQFGRNVLSEVGAKLINQFAECLAGQLADTSRLDAPATAGTAPDEPVTSTDAPSAPSAHSATAPASAPTSGGVPHASGGEAGQQRTSAHSRPAAGPRPAAAPPPSGEALDLLEIAGTPVLKRALPVIGALLALLSVVFVVRRKRRRASKAHR